MSALRSGRIWLAALVGLLAFAAASFLPGPAPAAAHPLGNFTINRYARIELSAGAIQVHYVLDMAEIPTFRERQAIDTDGDGDLSSDEQDAYLAAKVQDLRQGLVLATGSTRVALEPVGRALTFPPGQGGLDTLRLVVDYTAAVPQGSDRAPLPVEFRDENYAGRAGWREVVVRPLAGARVLDSTAPATDLSDELRAYPDDGLSNPLNVTGASFTFAPGAGSSPAPGGPAAGETAGAAEPSAGRRDDAFTSLITARDVTLSFVLAALAIAFGFGALHALGPGHGKTVVAAYLVGERGTARHALLLGLTVTATHTSSVFALGLATLYASQFIVPERLYPWLSLLSGLLVVGLGGYLLLTRLPRLRRLLRRAQAAHEHGHAHGGHEHAHDEGPVSLRSLVALGVSGGLLPCPSALVVLLGAISLQRVGLGMLLVVAFSLGLATVLTGIGLFLVWAGRLLGRAQALLSDRARVRLAWAARLAPALPALSALAITLVGVVMLVRALDSPTVLGL